MSAPTIRAEVLRVLAANGALRARQIDRLLPQLTSEQIQRACRNLRAENKIHVVDKAQKRNATFAIGPDPTVTVQSEAALGRLTEREYHLRVNPHLRDEWRPHPDPAAAWLFNRHA
ncbi:hypothetical protein KTE91_18145 [Burkholderia multivorans]|uniref:hypothetical protein n=1 Tax=Burkholderia multivorans TaxID=87883 RepID=UPI001C24CF28|nr:hypothetical protein [Burkholderia multivorans]MBU9437023.1 hypothetical protein [Burkholderia multivorans]